MIQRIQTVYLLIAEVLTICLFFFTLVTFLSTGNVELLLKINGIFRDVNGTLVKDVSTWPLVVLVSITTFIGFIVIFLYRHRLFQIRLCFFNMALNLGVFILLIYYIYSVSVVVDVKLGLRIVDIFPIVSIILYYLAYRAIAKDEAMVIASSFRSRKK